MDIEQMKLRTLCRISTQPSAKTRMLFSLGCYKSLIHKLVSNEKAFSTYRFDSNTAKMDLLYACVSVSVWFSDAKLMCYSENAFEHIVGDKNSWKKRETLETSERNWRKTEQFSFFLLIDSMMETDWNPCCNGVIKKVALISFWLAATQKWKGRQGSQVLWVQWWSVFIVSDTFLFSVVFFPPLPFWRFLFSSVLFFQSNIGNVWKRLSLTEHWMTFSHWKSVKSFFITSSPRLLLIESFAVFYSLQCVIWHFPCLTIHVTALINWDTWNTTIQL